MKHRPVITLPVPDPAEPITAEERERIEREPPHPELLRIIEDRRMQPLETCAHQNEIMAYIQTRIDINARQ